MKTKVISMTLFLIMVLALVGLLWPGSGEPRFTLAAPLARQVDWWTTDSGGEASSGPTYSVAGTLGQPDAGPSGGMNGGGYNLEGGFWAEVGSAAVGNPLYLPFVMR